LAIQLVLRDALMTQLDLPPTDVVLERRIVGGGLLDLWVEPLGLAIELKFHRGVGRPLTAQFGDILADLKKLVLAEAVERVFLLVTDAAGVTHLMNKALLPLRDTDPRSITAGAIEKLPFSARGRCISDGPWIPLSVRSIWHARLAGQLEGFAWSVSGI
jgi:hypothetical protein